MRTKGCETKEGSATRTGRRRPSHKGIIYSHNYSPNVQQIFYFLSAVALGAAARTIKKRGCEDMDRQRDINSHYKIYIREQPLQFIPIAAGHGCDDSRPAGK